MENRTYATRTEAIDCEIIEAVEAGEVVSEEYNIEAIADAVIGDFEDGYAIKVDETKFWEIVAENAN
nr:MAG TPA: hypothetical protein [Caudoviricetes sp.]